MGSRLYLHRLATETTLFPYSLLHAKSSAVFSPESKQDNDGNEERVENRLAYIGQMDMPSSLSGEMRNFHIHDHYQITLCTHGQITYYIGDEQITLEEQDILCVNQKVPHTWRAALNCKCLHLGYYQDNVNYNSVTERFLFDIKFIYSQQFPYIVIHRNEEQAEEFRRLLLQIEQYHNEKAWGYDALIHLNIEKISLMLALTQMPQDDPNWEGQRRNRAVNKAVEYIGKHYRDPINVNDVSGFVGMNNSYFSHLFHKIMGVSCKRYINLKRIEYSTVLLSNQDIDITNIAFASGFSSLSSFYKIFSEIYKISPKEYRRIVIHTNTAV